MNQTTDSKKYYPTALALYITYFVLGIAATIMGQYKRNFAAQWGAKVLENGSYDVSGVVAVIAAIGLGRQSIADPDLPNKALNGQLETLAPCIGCLLGCVPNMFAGKPITCAVNPCVGRETELTPADSKKKVVVVGGGPGGLYAAWLCALRGHQVTLLEKEEELGGNFRIAAYPTGKGQLTEVIRSIIVRCQNAGVGLRCNTEADEETLRSLSPDTIIVATGSNPLVLPIPGLADCGYITAQELLDGKKEAGKKVLVVGGGMVGCEAAEYLAERGHQVGIIEMKDVIAGDVTAESRKYIFQNFEENHVQLCPGA